MSYLGYNLTQSEIQLLDEINRRLFNNPDFDNLPESEKDQIFELLNYKSPEFDGALADILDPPIY